MENNSKHKKMISEKELERVSGGAQSFLEGKIWQTCIRCAAYIILAEDGVPVEHPVCSVCGYDVEHPENSLEFDEECWH